MISYYQKTITTKRLKKLDAFVVGCWVHVEEPTEADLEVVENTLKLDRGLFTDAVDQYEVPRVEVDNGVTYIFTRIPYKEGDQIYAAPVLVGVADTFVFTVCNKKLDLFERFVDGKLVFHTTQKVRFMLQILLEIDKAYAQYITRINKEVRQLSTGLSETMSNKDVIKFVGYETILNDLLDALGPTSVALQKLLSGKFLTLREEDKEFAEDVHLESVQLVELCRTNLRTIMNIRNAYSSIMTNNLNRVIKLLTSLTIVLMIPNIIVGFYGMNVALPFANAQHAFLFVLLFTALLTVITLSFFKSKELL